MSRGLSTRGEETGCSQSGGKAGRRQAGCESTDGRQAGSGSSGWCFLSAVGSEVALKESGMPCAP